jgi:hypothetical protein
MRHKLFLLVAAAVLLPLAVGCSGRSQVVRGQGPAGAIAVSPNAAGAAYDPNCVYEDECEEYCDDGRHCHGPGCKCHHCLPYHIPHDLSYPPMGDMPGVVQYPYYTCKGPDCFFYQGSSTR